MITSMKAVLDLAEARSAAVGAFNVTELEGIQAVLETAEEQRQPVILQFAPVHEEYISLKTLGPVMVLLADRAPVPVCVHLDHCGDFAMIREALEMGFSSVMYDGSLLPFRENAANTRLAVEMAAGYGASVEAELGAMGSEEGGAAESSYTDPVEAERFVREAGVDACIALVDTDPQQTKKQLEVVARAARGGIEGVRQSLSELRADALQHFQLDEAIRNMIKEMNSLSGVEVVFRCSVVPFKFGEDEENVIYRIIQEGITNALRHGKATRIQIAFGRRKGFCI